MTIDRADEGGRRSKEEDVKMLVPVVAVLVAGVIAGPGLATDYTITDLGTLGGSSSSALAINDSGVVLGTADLTGDTDQGTFLYNGSFPLEQIPVPNPFGMNDLGAIVGLFFPPNQNYHAYLYDGALHDLGTLSQYDVSSVAYGINDVGQIVGESQLDSGGYHAFVSTGGPLVDAGAPSGYLNSELFSINDAGRAVGNAYASSGSSHAFTYDVPTAQWNDVGVFPGGVFSHGQDINEGGVVVGLAALPGSPPYTYHAFRWTGSGDPQDLGTVPNYTTGSDASAINDSGQILGIAWDGDPFNSHGVLWNDGGPGVDLNDLLPPSSGWVIDSPYDINNAGQIVGSGYHDGQYHAFLMSPSTATPTGSNVPVSPTDEASGTAPVTLTFSNVSAAGATTLTIQTGGPVPPAGFELGNPAVYYELATTASFSGQIQVCIPYTGSSPALYHYEASVWVDVTSSASNGVVCGLVTSLSPFAVFYPTSSNRPPNVDANGPYFVGEGGSVDVSATGTDPDGEALAYAWDLDGNGTFETAGQTATFSAATIDGPATQAIAVRATDPEGFVAIASTSVAVANVAPSVGAITATDGPSLIGATISTFASFTDPAPADTHQATWTWGDGASSAGTIDSGSATGSHAYSGPGTYTIALTVTDDDGGVGTASASRTVIYKLCPLYDPSGAVKKGATVPIKLQLCDASNTNSSSANIVLHGQGVRRISSSATGPVEDSGSANPDNNFRYDANLGGTGGYVYNLGTKGLATGTYALEFTVGSEAYVYQARFGVR